MCSPLISLCLKKIADNLERYNCVFTRTEDDGMKLKFKFLQKKYSLELLKSLPAKKISDDCVDLLINKYLKVLDTSWFRECSWHKVSSKIAEMGSNIEQMFLCNWYNEYTDIFFEETPWQDIICHLPNLKSFTSDYCNDLTLKNVAKFCSNIEKINIVDSITTYEAVQYLCKNENNRSLCMKLKELYVGSTHLENDDVKYLLKNLPSLEIFDYEDLPLVLYSLHKNDLSSLDKVEPYNITMLDLVNFADKPFYVDILKICLSVCPRLKFFICCLESNDELNFFSNLSDLEMLHIVSFSDSEINIDNLLKSKGGKLTSLTVVRCTVSVSVLAESCPRIKKLILDRVNFLLSENLKPVFNSLSCCTFENLNVSSCASAISLLLLSSAKLVSIAFINCDSLSSEVKAHILKCCQLYPIKSIFFCCCNIENEYIKDLLLYCPTLSDLDIEDCFDIDKNELLKFANILPNKPKIIISYYAFDDEYDN